MQNVILLTGAKKDGCFVTDLTNCASLVKSVSLSDTAKNILNFHLNSAC